MKTALMIYIAMGVLSIVPLILFNIRKIWVRRPPDPIQFKASRFCVILVLCIGINFLGMTKIKTANMLPALLVPVLWSFLQPLFSGAA